MKAILVLRWTGLLGALSGLSLGACGGESSNFKDNGSGNEAGDGGTGGSQGGSSAKGGTGNGGTSKGGAGTGGTGGTVTPPDGVCEDITPCGGDPTGTWNIADNCTEVVVDVGAELGCEGVEAAGSATLEGTFTFADGMMTQNTVQTVFVTMLIDDACAETLTMLPGVTAADVCPLVNAQLMMNPDTPGTCEVDTGGCRCNITQAPTPTMESSPYEIVGNQIVITSADGTTTPIDFCVEGSDLHLHADGVDVATAAVGSLTLLLERQ